jgi:hypothetical protein
MISFLTVRSAYGYNPVIVTLSMLWCTVIVVGLFMSKGLYLLGTQ